MKNIAIIALLLLATACSSPVEEYIKNDFSRIVREEGLDEEVEAEIERIIAQMKEMAVEANPDAKESEKLMAEYQRIKRDVESRMSSYERTGNYNYIIGIAGDAEKGDALYAKAQRLKKKVKPYINHVDKQVDAFTEALSCVEHETMMNSTNLVKNDSVTMEYIFNNVIGVPESFANPGEEELENIAVAVLTNYFIDNPTPVVKISKYQKDDENWYIKLSNDRHYLLNAIKCDNGEYDFEYKEVDDSFDKNSNKKSSTAQSSNKKGKKNSGSCDEFLDDYEDFVDDYVKQYKKLYKKSMSGDLSVLEELQELAEEAAEFAEEYEDFDGEMSQKQVERYLKITKKMSDAMMDM